LESGGVERVSQSDGNRSSIPKVLYFSHGPTDLYELIASKCPSSVELLTLQADSDDERRAKLTDSEVVIVSTTRLTRELIEAAPSLRLVHLQGVGFQDTVDVEALSERGIVLAITPEGTTISVAEHAVLLMLAVYRRLPYADAELRAGRWHTNSLRSHSRELFGRAVGYVGMGRIGQAAAERLRAFGTTGVYFDDLAPLSKQRATKLGLRRVGFEELLAESDIVTLHVPLTPDTFHLIDSDAMGRMRRGAILVNTCRGGVVDEAALYEALARGHLAGAGLDVFEGEPPSKNSPLLDFPTVVVTPHISAGTRDAFLTKMEAIFANIVRFYDGKPIANRVDSV
jgi:phosphoglycerate dehydrogenase-like enzyme